MPDKKISELDNAAALTGAEEVPIVQTSTTKKMLVKDVSNKLIVKAKTATGAETVDLDDSDYDNMHIMKLSWTGAAGTATYTLPDATASKNTNRIIRFISDNTYTNSTKVNLTPAASQTLDNSSSAYTINKAYEGIAVWSDGNEWFIIQKKA